MRSTAIALTALVTLAGCSDTSEDTAAEASDSASTPANTSAAESPSEEPSLEPPSESPEKQLEDAYRTYVDAFLTGDGATAYQLLSDRCRAQNKLSEFAAIAEQAAEVYGPLEYTVESVEVNGDEGSVDASYPVAALNDEGGSPWLMENGEWHSDKCG